MLDNKSKPTRVNYKTEYDIPTFSIKSALYLIFGGVTSTMMLPMILSLVGLSFNASVVIGNTFILGYILAYTRFFIETKRGYCNKFWTTYIGFGLAFGLISYLWLYEGVFI